MSRVAPSDRIMDRANREFWEELCGTPLAASLGITSHDGDSLQKYDEAYLAYYPYLLPLVRPWEMAGQTVLEIGLGYGTLGQKMAEQAGCYLGLDNSSGPVAMMNHRLDMAGLRGGAVQGSALSIPFGENTFDHLVSIGCFHHTGDTQRCVEEAFRVLKPGGRAVVMLYNRFSWRQWRRWPLDTARALLSDRLGLKYGGQVSLEQRRAYDARQGNVAAPKTDFFSKKNIRALFRRFSTKKIRARNCDRVIFYNGGRYVNAISLEREFLLPYVGPLAGLDLYVEAIK